MRCKTNKRKKEKKRITKHIEEKSFTIVSLIFVIILACICDRRLLLMYHVQCRVWHTVFRSLHKMRSAFLKMWIMWKKSEWMLRPWWMGSGHRPGKYVWEQCEPIVNIDKNDVCFIQYFFPFFFFFFIFSSLWFLFELRVNRLLRHLDPRDYLNRYNDMLHCMPNSFPYQPPAPTCKHYTYTQRPVSLVHVLLIWLFFRIRWTTV